MKTCLFLVCAFATASAVRAGIIADSIDDWNAARLDGIGVGGSSVTPGSPDDAPQQHHTDGTGSGSWSYGFGNGADGQSFSGGFPLLNTWTGGAWNRDGFGFVSANAQGPLGPTFAADPMAYRRWTSTGAFAGDMLTAILTVTFTGEFGDGATIIFSSTGQSQSLLLEPGDLGVEQTFELSFIDGANQYVLVGIRPEGVNGNPANNHLFDSAEVHLTIVPAPATLAIAAPLSAAVLLRRRR